MLTWSAFPDWATAPVESSPLLEYEGMQTPPACRYLTKIMSLRKLTSRTREHRQSNRKVTGLSIVRLYCDWACSNRKGYWWHSWRNSHTESCLADRFYPRPLEKAFHPVASHAAGAPPHARGTDRHGCLWRHGADWTKWERETMSYAKFNIYISSICRDLTSLAPWSRPTSAEDRRVTQLCWCREATSGHFLDMAQRIAV